MKVIYCVCFAIADVSNVKVSIQNTWSLKLLMDLKKSIIRVDHVKLILIILMVIRMIIVKNVIITINNLSLDHVLKLSISFLWYNPLHRFFSTILIFLISFTFLFALKNSKHILHSSTIIIKSIYFYIIFYTVQFFIAQITHINT